MSLKPTSNLLGILMTAIWETMNGVAGLPGWRWVRKPDNVQLIAIANATVVVYH